MTSHRFIVTLCFLSVLSASPVHAQIARSSLDGTSGVGIDDLSGTSLPLLTTFTDSSGKTIKLGSLFDGKRPVVLSFNYAECPLLCKLQLTGLVDSLRQLEWTAGQEFRVVSISIDPSETVQQASIARQKHLQLYGRSGSSDGWSFLTGTPDAISATADAAGFRYKFLPKQREYSHSAAAIVCTPDGVISRYLYGVQFDPETLRLTLAEAGNGQIGSPLDKLLLFCFRYDSATGKYAPAAWNLMRLGAITTILVLCGVVLRFRTPWERSAVGK
jgi:protein SCO1/2